MYVKEILTSISLKKYHYLYVYQIFKLFSFFFWGGGIFLEFQHYLYSLPDHNPLNKYWRSGKELIYALIFGRILAMPLVVNIPVILQYMHSHGCKCGRPILQTDSMIHGCGCGRP